MPGALVTLFVSFGGLPLGKFVVNAVGLVEESMLGAPEGWQEVSLKGLEVGSRLGDSDGLAVGASLGLLLGRKVGFSVVFALGSSVGGDVGPVKGLEEGTSVGDELEANESRLGSLVGPDVVRSVGSESVGRTCDGFADGDSLDAPIRETEGLLEGTTIGLKEGEAIGDKEGADNGACGKGLPDGWLLVGPSLGIDEGTTLSPAEGRAVVRTLGELVGADDGLMEGLPVWARKDGPLLGVELGVIVGRFLGSSEEKRLNSADGPELGARFEFSFGPLVGDCSGA
jgi:hypothetical protein